MPYGEAFFTEPLSYYRETATIYGPVTVLASVSGLTLTPNTHIRVSLDGFVDTGDDGSGTVTLVGTDVADAALSESLTFFINGERATRKRFKTITGYSTSGLTNETTVGTIELERVAASGNELIVEWTLIGTSKGRLSRSRRGEVMTSRGNVVQEAGILHTRTDFLAAALDKVTVRGEPYEIVGAFSPRDRFGVVQFYRYSIKELESPAE